MNLRVETHSGSIQGFEENGLYKYLGIPYAQKPLGDLRLKRCVPGCSRPTITANPPSSRAATVPRVARTA